MPAEQLVYLRIGRILDEGDRASPGAPAFLQVVYAPNGRTVMNRTLPFHIPSTVPRSEDILQCIERAVLSSNPADRGVSSEAYGKIMDVGQSLFAGLCEQPGPRDVLRSALRDEGEGLRLLLHFDQTADDLAEYPWEALKPPDGDFIIRRGNHVVARHVSGRHWLGASPKQELRMLVVASSLLEGGSDCKLESFIHKEREVLEEALGEYVQKGLIRRDLLVNPTPAELERALSNRIDVLHYIGHGDYDPKGEFVYLRSARSSSGERIYWEDIFKPTLTANLRLLVLNACRLESQARVASGLATFGASAVIAMKSMIGAEVIADYEGFTAALYGEIAAGRAVHQAYSAALGSIWWSSRVETFVPTLVLSNLTELVLLNPADRRVLQIRHEADERRRQSAGVAQRIRAALSDGDYESLAEVVGDAEPLVREHVVLGVLKTAFQDLRDEVERLHRLRRWIEARPICAVLRRIAALLPELRAALPACAEMEAHTRAVLEQLETEIQSASRSNNLEQVVERSARYLEAEPGNTRIRELRDRAQKVLSDSQQIRWLDGDVNGERLSTVQELINRREWDSAIEEAHGEQADAETRARLVKALSEEIPRLRRANDWKRAVDFAEELLRLMPNAETSQVLGETLLGCGEYAERRSDWETALAVARRIEQSPEAWPWAQENAARLRKRAEETLDLARRIQWL